MPGCRCRSSPRAPGRRPSPCPDGRRGSSHRRSSRSPRQTGRSWARESGPARRRHRLGPEPPGRRRQTCPRPGRWGHRSPRGSRSWGRHPPPGTRGSRGGRLPRPWCTRRSSYSE